MLKMVPALRRDMPSCCTALSAAVRSDWEYFIRFLAGPIQGAYVEKGICLRIIHITDFLVDILPPGITPILRS